MQKIDMLKIKLNTHKTNFEGHISDLNFTQKEKVELYLKYEAASKDGSDYKAKYEDSGQERSALQHKVDLLLGEISGTSLKIETHITQSKFVIKERDD
jgi:hypothetical protein